MLDIAGKCTNATCSAWVMMKTGPSGLLSSTLGTPSGSVTPPLQNFHSILWNALRYCRRSIMDRQVRVCCVDTCTPHNGDNFPRVPSHRQDLNGEPNASKALVVMKEMPGGQPSRPPKRRKSPG